MPFLITQGYGNQGDGSSSALATTLGFGGPGLPSGLCNTFVLLLTEVYVDRIELVFSTNITISGPATVPSQWTITSVATGVPIPTVTSVTSAGPRVKVYYTEGRAGNLYTLAIPVVGIKDVSANPFPGPYTTNFLGVGISPFVVVAGADDGQHVKVIFSEPVQSAGALLASNYTITGGAGLVVYDVTQVNSQIYELHTSLQVVGQAYTLTVTNILDLLGNPI